MSQSHTNTNTHPVFDANSQTTLRAITCCQTADLQLPNAVRTHIFGWVMSCFCCCCQCWCWCDRYGSYWWWSCFLQIGDEETFALYLSIFVSIHAKSLPQFIWWNSNSQYANPIENANTICKQIKISIIRMSNHFANYNHIQKLKKFFFVKDKNKKAFRKFHFCTGRTR